MARQGKPNISNSAVRIFLQNFGGDYDEMRSFLKYQKKRDLPKYAEFFENTCCYCAKPFNKDRRMEEDHLQPVNKTGLGLNAVGNIVACCPSCNALKREREWREFLPEVAGRGQARRAKRIEEFISHYKYEPNSKDLSAATRDLYAEVGEVAMALINTKTRRTRETIASRSSGRQSSG